MSNAGMRTVGPSCGCTDECLILSDNFNDMAVGIKNGVVDGNWYANLDLSSYGADQNCWSVTADHWLRVDNLDAVANGQSGGPFRFFYRGDVPRHFAAKVKMRPVWEGSIGSIVYANTYNNIGGPWYRLEVVASDATYGDADAEKACGTLRIRRLLPNNLTVEVPIPGLCAFGTDESYAGMHQVQMCYNPDNHILSGKVTTCFGRVFWIYTNQAVPVPSHVNNFNPTTGTGVTNLWFEATNWGASPTTDGGIYFFDDFRLSLAKNTPEDPYGYYYYGYGDSEPDSCPCCGGCVRTGVTFNLPGDDGLRADEVDCQISQSGSATQTGATLLATSPTTLTWLGSHSGVGVDCQPMTSQAVTVSAASAAYGAQVSVSIGTASATLTFDSYDGAGDGSLALTGEDPVTVSAPINIPVTLRLCATDDMLIAHAAGEYIVKVTGSPTTNDSVQASLDTDTSISSWLIDFGCTDDCIPDDEGAPNDCDWCDGETVPTVLAFRPHIPTDTAGMPDCNFCDLIHDRTFVMKYGLGCAYTQEGGLHLGDPCDWVPGCNSSPDSSDICFSCFLNFAIDSGTGHLIGSGSVVVFSNFFTCVIRFEQDFGTQYGEDNHPDCQAFFTGAVRLPFKEFYGNVAPLTPCNLCGRGGDGSLTDTSLWYLEVVGL